MDSTLATTQSEQTAHLARLESSVKAWATYLHHSQATTTEEKRKRSIVLSNLTYDIYWQSKDLVVMLDAVTDTLNVDHGMSVRKMGSHK